MRIELAKRNGMLSSNFGKWTSDMGKEMNSMKDWLSDISNDLRHSEDVQERFIGTELSGESLFQGTVESHLTALGTLVKDPDFIVRLDNMSKNNVDYYIRFPPEAVKWGTEFIVRFMKEIRTAICGAKSEYNVLGNEGAAYPKAIAAAIASQLTTVMGLQSALAIGVGTLILLILTKATKNAFCQMTDSEVEAKLKKPSAKD